MSKEKDSDVGYGKPPRNTRFKKGRSGNPNGRPKGSQNFVTDLEEVLSAKVTVTENGKPQKVSSQRAAMMRLREKALKGDARALDSLLRLAQEQHADQASKAEERQLSASEDDILTRFEDDLLARAKRPSATPVGGGPE